MNSGISILVVDDEPNNFDTIEGMLMGQGYDLDYAPNGRDAIDSLGQFFNPDVILLDVMMPEMDGIAVCRHIKSMPEWQAVPIIMVTALTSKEDLARCLRAGADDFISKPISATELRARVQSMTRIKQQYDQLQTSAKLHRSTVELLEGSLAELRGNLASSFSHELNTPLNGILSSLLLLSDHFDELDKKEMQEIINIGSQSARRLETLTQRFLTYLYLELETNKQQTTTAEPTHPCTITSFIPAIAQARAETAGRSEDLVIDIENLRIGITSKHLEWLLDELLDNAFNFSDAHTTVTLSGRLVHQTFQLEVRDEGRGMTQDQVARIGAFIQFERHVHGQSGFGLGLRIAQRVVALYGGKFLISSVYQKGTTVKVSLPMADQQANPWVLQ
ncbi:MAG: response regulator [Leptolyngbyaceae cyanobacterium]